MFKGHLVDYKCNENQNSTLKYFLWTKFGLTIDLLNISIVGILYKKKILGQSKNRDLILGIASESPIFNEENESGKFIWFFVFVFVFMYFLTSI